VKSLLVFIALLTVFVFFDLKDRELKKPPPPKPKVFYYTWEYKSGEGLVMVTNKLDDIKRTEVPK
jgi:hypothetical protein